MREMFLITAMSIFLVSCSYSISLVHTEGHAEDVIDDTKTNTTDVAPSLSVPVSGL